MSFSFAVASGVFHCIVCVFFFCLAFFFCVLYFGYKLITVKCELIGHSDLVMDDLYFWSFTHVQPCDANLLGPRSFRAKSRMTSGL